MSCLFVKQMCLAYETHELKLPEHQFRIHPDSLYSMHMDRSQMIVVMLIHKGVNREEVKESNKGGDNSFIGK